MACEIHSVEPDTPYVGCVCTYGGVYEVTQTEWAPVLDDPELDALNDDDVVVVSRVFDGRATNHGLRWTQEEIDFLRERMYTTDIREGARLLGRTKNACYEMYYYGSSEAARDQREAARRENARIESSYRGRFSGTSLEEMGF